jgi:glycosyltransferase involved in cell wall biosynthesis
MRVLHLMASGELSGGGAHLGLLLPALRRLGVECEVALSEKGPLGAHLRDLGFCVHALDLFRSRVDPTAPRRLARLVRSVRPDRLHCHGTRAAFFGALARPLLPFSLPILYTVHGLSYRKELGVSGRAVFLAAEALACRAASRVITVSRADLEDLVRRRFVSPARVVHVANPIDLERFCPGDRDRARGRLGLPSDVFLAGTVSRLVPGKAVGDLLDAIALCPDVQLLVVGDGPERPALEARARRLSGRVRFLGARDDVPEILRALDLFVLSSRWEGEPVALLEAMATGLPCIATATSGAREILEEGRAGLLVPVGDRTALASAITRAVRLAAERSRMGAAALARVSGRQAVSAAAAVLALYERCA